MKTISPGGLITVLLLSMVMGSIALYCITRNRQIMRCTWFTRPWYSALGVTKVSATTVGGTPSTQLVLVQNNKCKPYEESSIAPGSDAYPAIARHSDAVIGGV